MTTTNGTSGSLIELAIPKPILPARVGLKAPEFAGPAYHQGRFTDVSLSDAAGRWLLLLFYPGDFTFV